MKVHEQIAEAPSWKLPRFRRRRRVQHLHPRVADVQAHDVGDAHHLMGGTFHQLRKELAVVEMKMALATILFNFDVESVATADGSEPQELFSFTMEPAPLAMRLAERRIRLRSPVT